MSIYQLLPAVFAACLLIDACPYDNCRDWKKHNPNIGSGEFQVSNGQGQNHKVYCEFYNDYGYMFIPKDVSVPVNMNLLNPGTSEALIRHRRKNNLQYESTVSQITAYSSVPLSIQYNTFASYQKPVNADTLCPYLYLGFLPRSIAASKTTQGYRVNGKDATFHNCDANGNSYMAFYFDSNNGTPVGYYKRCCYNAFMRKWADDVRPTTHTLSSEYFFQMEMHMGGCGGYSLTGFNSQSDIVGVALGIRFEL